MATGEEMYEVLASIVNPDGKLCMSTEVKCVQILKNYLLHLYEIGEKKITKKNVESFLEKADGASERTLINVYIPAIRKYAKFVRKRNGKDTEIDNVQSKDFVVRKNRKANVCKCAKAEENGDVRRAYVLAKRLNAPHGEDEDKVYKELILEVLEKLWKKMNQQEK